VGEIQVWYAQPQPQPKPANANGGSQ